ncbi:hypothetical protein [Spirulina subsalsa]|nr:hypothetical protein [Spirulina subsalsa]
MYGQLNNGFSSTSCRIQSINYHLGKIAKRLHRFRLMDLIIVPLVALFSLIIMGFTVMSFVTTLTPNPTWPVLVTTVLTFSGASKSYWEVSHYLWELPDGSVETWQFPVEG